MTLGRSPLRTEGAEVNIAFTRSGQGPTVVLLHGTSASHAVWQPIVDSLSATAHVVSLDQRGHGRSDKPSTGYRGVDFAHDVITVLDFLGIDQAIVAGHSLGARNAWMAAALFPDRVISAVCVDYTPFVEPVVLDDLVMRVAAGYRSFDSPTAIETYLHERYGRLPADAVERRARWGYEQRDDGLWWPLADPNAMTQLIDGLRDPQLEEFLAVQTQMSHIRGKDSKILSAAAWQSALDVRPTDRWVEDAKCDHYVAEEAPERVRTEIAHLLNISAPHNH